MPLPGDQHRDTHATTNPFADNRPHITEYTAQEIATLQSRLDKQLGPEYISTRPGAGGGKVHYLAAEKVINLANEVFGFNGWSSAIQNVQIDFVDENPGSQKITLGLSCIVRVTVRDGTFHEDIGYGHIENCKGKAAAFEKAKKEAATDALKRALRNFGNVLGNCLYDKDYLSKVTKVKVAPSRWDAENLHRHPDFAPIKKESIAEAEAAAQQEKVQQERALQETANIAARRQSSAQSGGSYGSAEFEDDYGASGLDDRDFTHPDEVELEDSAMLPTGPETPAKRAITGPQQGAQRHEVPRMHSMPHLRPPNVQPPAPIQQPQAPQRPAAVQRPPNNAAQISAANRMPPPQQNGVLQRPQQAHPPPQAQGPQQRPPQPQPPQQQHPPARSDGARSNPSSATTVADSPSDVPPQNGAQCPVPSVDGQIMDDAGMPPPRMPPPGAPEGFVTGRSVDLLNAAPDARPPNTAIAAFDPHKESPSIPRTNGINPGRSAPVRRSAINGQPPPGPAPHTNGANGATTPVRTNFVNPSADMNRRIGAPQIGGGGIQNRGQYRPPTAVGVKRPALADVSNLPQTDGAGDAKKAKIEPTAAGDGGGGEGGGQAAAAAS